MFGTALLLTVLLPQALGETPSERLGIFTFRPPPGRRPQIVDTRPELIERPFFALSYSREARRLGIQGSVRLEAFVAEDGRVSDVKVVRSLHADLDSASVEAVKKLRFRPARYQGRAVCAPVPVRVTFSLEDQKRGPRAQDTAATIVTVQIGEE